MKANYVARHAVTTSSSDPSGNVCIPVLFKRIPSRQEEFEHVSPITDRATERRSDRAIERSSDRATERSRDRSFENSYLRKVHNSSSRASSDTMPEPSDVENCWVTRFTRIGASNDPNIVQKVTQRKKRPSLK